MKSKYRRTWFGLVIVVFVSSMACGLVGDITNIAEQAGGAKGTIEAMVTDIDDFATQAVEFATQAGDSGLVETAQSMGTQLPEAAQEMQETAKAMVDEINTGETPEDIPLISPSEENFFSNNSFVTYNTEVDFETVLSFYQEEMPLNGWEPGDAEVQTNSTALLQYTKDGRTAAVALSTDPSDGSTLVVITIIDL